MTVLVVGEALVDVVDAGGATQTHPGGSPFNVAVGLARLGVEVELACQVGDDEHGALLRDVLAAEGVGVSPTAPATRTSVATARIDDGGNADYDFDLTWDPGELPDPIRYEAVHVGSLGTLIEPGASLVADLVVTADAVGTPVTYDPNVRPSVAEAAAWRSVVDRIRPHASLVKGSSDDVDLLFPGVDHLTSIEHLAGTGRLVVLTRAGSGALVAQGGRHVEIPAVEVDVVDTIGAGDSFMAAMLAWHASYQWPRGEELDDDELLDLGTYAARAAAITCSRPGADPPHLDEL